MQSCQSCFVCSFLWMIFYSCAEWWPHISTCIWLGSLMTSESTSCIWPRLVMTSDSTSSTLAQCSNNPSWPRFSPCFLPGRGTLCGQASGVGTRRRMLSTLSPSPQSPLWGKQTLSWSASSSGPAASQTEGAGRETVVLAARQREQHRKLSKGDATPLLQTESGKGEWERGGDCYCWRSSQCLFYSSEMITLTHLTERRGH